MNDWFGQLQKAKDLFTLQWSIAPGGLSSVMVTPEDYVRYTIQTVSARQADNKRNKILNNIQIAAMHLHYILSGNLDLYDNVMFPDQTTSSETMNLRHFRLPLLIAAFVSPICLFLPKKFYGMEASRFEILSMWKKLGNERPIHIQKIEDCIWRLLLRLPQSQTIEEEVNKCFLDMGLSDLQLMKEDLDWFSSTAGQVSLTAGPHTETQEDDAMDIDKPPAPAPSMHLQAPGNAGPILRRTSLRKRQPQIAPPPQAGSSCGKITRRPGRSQVQVAGLQSNHRDEDNFSMEDVEKARQVVEEPITLSWDAISLPSVTNSPAVNLYSVERTRPLSYAAPSRLREQDVSFFQQIVSQVNRFPGNLPQHLHKPSSSSFYFIKHSELIFKPALEIQEIFRTHHIVITDIPSHGPTMAFDRQGLESLGSWKNVRTMQDFSINVEDGDFSKRIVHGTLEQLYAHSQEDNGRILNALDFPLASGPPPQSAFATDVRAWDFTLDMPLAGRTVEYPRHHMRWGLAATKGAQHTWHVDAEGMATYIQPKTGSKYWVVARPKASRKDAICLTDDSVVADVSAPNQEYWDIEGILLIPGMELYMQPYTFHCVFTPQHSICHGGHFLSTATLRQTCYGLIHAFVASSVITNTEHRDAWIISQRMMQYYHCIFTTEQWDEESLDFSHVPNLHSSERMQDLLIFMVVLELSNALDTATYTKMGVPKQDRIRAMEARRLSRDLLTWIHSRYIIQPLDRSLIDHPNDIVKAMVATLCVRLVQYMQEARKRQAMSANTSCNLKTFSRELYDSICDNRVILNLISNKSQFLKGECLTCDIALQVIPRQSPLPFTSNHEDPNAGCTPGDAAHLSKTQPPSAEEDIDHSFFM